MIIKSTLTWHGSGLKLPVDIGMEEAEGMASGELFNGVKVNFEVDCVGSYHYLPTKKVNYLSL